MLVGVNYPWRDYGWDFGVAPPGWRVPDAPPRWISDIDSHLLHFRALGIRVVRWFVLGDGLTCGTGAAAPQYAPDETWHFNPAPLSPRFLNDFEDLLIRFEASHAGPGPGVQLLPVLVDFHFCHPGKVVAAGWVKSGRADAIADPFKQQQFLDTVLEPLLDASARHRDAIYAWEVMNEPEWVTLGWDPRMWRTQAIDQMAMERFLEEGCGRVRRAGFRSTVGFALGETMLGSRVKTEIAQFHHYPAGARELGRAPRSNQDETILGEFATTTSDAWPDLPDWDQTVLNRLRLAADRGFDLAMPWSYLATDRHTSWSSAVERDIEYFTQQRNRPEPPQL